MNATDQELIQKVNPLELDKNVAYNVRKDGKAIVYTVSEDAVEGYSTSLVNCNGTFKFINTHDDSKVNITINKVWEDNPYGAENTVAVHIRHLREKLEINPAEPRYLKVVWGQGYKIENIAK